MNDNTEKARSILIEGGYTCVICNDDHVMTFTERGVKPLLSLLDTKESFKGYSDYCADSECSAGCAGILY